MADDGGHLRTAAWCPGAESNHRHCDFQSHALPTELPGRRPRAKPTGQRSAGVIEAASRTVQNAPSSLEPERRPEPPLDRDAIALRQHARWIVGLDRDASKQSFLEI